MYSVEENLRRRCGGGDGAQFMQRLMCAQVLAGKVGERLCLGLVAMDGHDLDFLAGGETEALEGLKRAYDFSPAAVRHDDSASIRQVPWDGHYGSGAIAKHLGKRGVRPILGHEVKMRLAPEDDHVAAWRLAQDAIYGIADALDHFGRDARCRASRPKVLEHFEHVPRPSWRHHALACKRRLQGERAPLRE